MTERDVVIVGAGLAGLSCATYLRREGLDPLVLEGSDRPGGRVRTDEVEGFLLDRGFQVLLPAYRTARELLDYDRLHLRAFEPGALVRVGGKFARVGDPRRRPASVTATLAAPVGGMADKLRILKLERHLRAFEGRPGTTSLQALRSAGFTDRMIDRFFRPFLGGVFLERELSTDASFLSFVWPLFSSCDASLPAAGMEALPRQLAEALPAETLRTGVEVTAVDATSVTLASGERLQARAVVVATDGSAARRLLGRNEDLRWNAVTCLYYDAPSAPVPGPLLLLDGDGGPINNVCFPSQVAPSYAPAGRQLASVTVLGDPARLREEDVRAELVRWFGAEVNDWGHLRSYAIPNALPANADSASHTAGATSPFVCGDHTESPSIEGALASGKRAANAVRAALQPSS